MPLFRTLKGGLGQLVDAIADAISGKVEVRPCRAQTIQRAEAGFRIKLDDGGWLEADQVVVACEAHSGSALLAGVDGRLAELLGTVPYSSSMTVALGFDAADLRAPAAWFRFPGAQEGAPAAGGVHLGWHQFPYRVPEGKVVARCFLGGMEDAGVLDESDEAVGAAVTRELQEIAGFTARPRFTRISRWPRSMAQYTVGHPQRLAEMQARTPPAGACTWRATPTKASESPTASAWGGRRPSESWGGDVAKPLRLPRPTHRDALPAGNHFCSATRPSLV